MGNYTLSEETTVLLNAVKSLDNAYKDACKAFQQCFCNEEIPELEDAKQAFQDTTNKMMRIVSMQIEMNLSMGDTEL